jgi:hypothetical protein
MGIRMNLSVGYGLDLKGLHTGVLQDYEKLECKKRFVSWRHEVRQYAQDNVDLADKYATNQKQMSAADCLTDMVEYQGEFGLPDKLLLIPSMYRRSWHRYGNHLDAFEYEAYHKADDPDWMDTEWIERPGCLHPFIGLMRANEEHPNGVEFYWEPCYLDQDEHKDAIPKAPMHLWYLLKHLELAPTERTTELFLRLRPTLYRYWS